MNKLKTLAGTAMAAAVIGAGALATAPSASALSRLPPQLRGDHCSQDQIFIYRGALHALNVLGYGDTEAADDLYAKLLAAENAYAFCRSPAPDPLV
jgi:hypothetical protein